MDESIRPSMFPDSIANPLSRQRLTMPFIQLDLSRLYGFKILADKRVEAPPAGISGTKAGGKVGSKLGSKSGVKSG